MPDLSVLIPARNEQFVSRTVQDILEHAEADLEIIVVLDGALANPPLPRDKRVQEIYLSTSIGQRAATNLAARMAQGRYVMKVDAHCAFAQGFDRVLLEDMAGHDDWCMVPTMKNLHIFDWLCPQGHRRYQGPSGPCKECGQPTTMDVVWRAKPSPQSTAYCFDSEPHFQYFKEFRKRPEGKGDLTETMSLQGSCWLLTRERYFALDVCDEAFGSWGSQGIEVAMRVRLSGGKVVCNQRTYYAHLFRTQGADFGFPYPISGAQVEHAKKHARDLFFGNKWEKQIYPLSMVIEQFWPIPGWSDEDLSKLKKSEMEVERPGIYSIKNTTNGKVYIGSAISIARRFSEHLRMLRRNDHENCHLQNSWNKYGEENFSFNIEYFCPEDDLVSNEQVFIDLYSEKLGWDNLYNMNPHAGSALGRKHTLESLQKMSEQQSGEGNGFYGKRHSPESIEKMKEAHKGHPAWNKGIAWSDEVKARISAAKIGGVGWNKGLTKETDDRVRAYAEKLAGGHPWENKEHPRGMLGKHHTDETKAIISASSSRAAQTRPRDEHGHFLKYSDAGENRTPTRGILYYTDNRINIRLALACRKTIEASGLPITSVTLKPTRFGRNIVVEGERSYKTMFRQILTGLEAMTEDIVYFTEHDVLYSKPHFNFIPARPDCFYYEGHYWMLRLKDGFAVHYDVSPLSGLVAYREALIRHFRERLALIEKQGFGYYMGFEPFTHRRIKWQFWCDFAVFQSPQPCIDLAHSGNLTQKRFSQKRFIRKPKFWEESDVTHIPGWPDLPQIVAKFREA